MIEILTLATIITPVTSGLVQAVKISTHVNKRYLQISSIVVGIGLGASATFLDTDSLVRIWAGGISGLAATGLFELSKRDKVDDGK